MTDVVGAVNVQKFELSCNQKLNKFATKLNEHSTTFKKHVQELQRISGALVYKSEQLERLERNDSNDVSRFYSREQQNMVISEALNQANLEVAGAKRLIDEIYDLYDDLRTSYRYLLAAATALQISSSVSALVVGDAKQKSINYYTEEACILLSFWQHFHRCVKHLVYAIDLRSNESMETLQTALNLPDDFRHRLEEYLLFCRFILKRNS